MKLVKSLLLGSAAGLAAVAGAQAADLPAKGKVAAVEYVRVCSAYGAGFFFIPGTETCLRVGGRVRADALYFEPFTRANDGGDSLKGVGLGLFIVHEIVAAHGGHIQVTSTRETGTVFQLRLPRDARC